MSEPTRIALRLLGLVLLLAGIAGIVLLFEPGPGEIADWMGDECAHGRNESGGACNALDVIEVLAAAPLLILVGGVLVLAMRKGPLVLDFSSRRR